MGFDDWPSEPERMVAMRSDGEVVALHVNAGTLQSLWKFNPTGLKSRHSIGVSRDGQFIALVFSNGAGNLEVEVRQLATGEKLGGMQVEGVVPSLWMRDLSIVTLSENICLFRGAIQKDSKETGGVGLARGQTTVGNG